MSPLLSDVILLTGSTGFVGFQILLDALKAGFRVKAAVRSEVKAQTLLKKPILKSLLENLENIRTDTNAVHKSRLEFVIVPDFLKDGAFGEAVQGVDYVIHAASPLLQAAPDDFKDAQRYFIGPAKNGTLQVLNAAAKATECGKALVKRIVITSSVGVFFSPKVWQGVEVQRVPLGPDHRLPLMEPPYVHNGHAYAASKLAALEAAERWVMEKRPSFGIVHIHPSWVLGRCELADSVQDLLATTNQLVLGPIIKGRSLTWPVAMGAGADVEDVSQVHLRALTTTNAVEPGTCTSFIASVPATFEDVPDLIRTNFPQDIAAGRITITGEQQSWKLPLDVTKTETVLGIKFKGFEQIARDIVAQYLEIIGGVP